VSILFRTVLISANSNEPCEDVLRQKMIEFSSTLNYSLFGVYDGHNGNKMSNFLGDTLIYAVLGQLFQLYSKDAAAENQDHIDVGGRFNVTLNELPDGDQQLQLKGEEFGLIKGLHESTYPSDKEIDLSIKEAFMSLDSLAVHELTKLVLDRPLSKEEGVRLLSLPNAGSCALLGIYNNIKRTFKVAVTGDSRAVLGRRVALKDDTYAYETHVLSADQNAYNPLEVERLEAAHPGETIFEKGRTLGWGMTRAFGDAVCKWSLEIQQRLHEEYLGDRIQSNYLTPPYFTAEPEITTTTIRKGDFVVLASDGLWDCLTSEEVVGLVGGWLETRGGEVKIGKGKGIGEGEKVMLPLGIPGRSGQDHKKGFGKGRGYGWPEGSNGGSVNKVAKEVETTIWERTDLPVTSIKPDDTPMYKWWHATKRFVNIDSNSAVHLARNAIGGADRDLTGALLRMKPPRSRRYR
jgi:pyruvate dehydrogenase phosphatase